MKNTINYQKGSAKTATIALVILVIFLIAGAVVYHDSDEKEIALESKDDGGYMVASTTQKDVVVTKTNTTEKSVYVPAHTVVRTSPGTPFAGGTTYHNAAYDLTVFLPASYQGYKVTIGQDSYTGVSDTASIHFTAPNGNNFTVNVFSMEQWNKIRTIENAAHQNVNSYGEGDYLGENFHFIYSTNGSEPQLQAILDQVRFY